MNDRPAASDVQDLRLERWIPGGLCLAHAQGYTWMVAYGVPGELVSAQVTRRARGVVFADVVEVHESSPHRVVAPCAYFGRAQCGGCDVQHVDLGEQRRMKREIVVDSLARMAGVDRGVSQGVGSTLAIPGDIDGLGWRTRISGVRTSNGIGFHRMRSSDIVSVRACLIASPGLIEAVTVQVVPGSGFRAARGDDSGTAIDVTSEAQGPPPTVAQSVETSVAVRRWRLPVHAFWQVHAGAAQFLGSLVFGLLGDTRDERWWDLYGGAGLFSAFLCAGGASRVDLVESDHAAVRAARRAFHDEPAVSIQCRDVCEWLSESDELPDGVLVDPPRRGCDASVIEAIGRVRPRRLMYVSCDPGSFARDTARLIALGFRPRYIIPVDAFPMTHHVETVALFVPGDQIS